MKCKFMNHFEAPLNSFIGTVKMLYLYCARTQCKNQKKM